ncbi:MAG: flavodoxin-dependent (E)-4-hydroxy-3-methylbut-2-enyl-diphosphate synthase [Dehalococcoidales bacterium]|nr:flavodoxin-dependent (E)-4-hydroxy-3-methylbut-2-enyl-diphosphate synthase [Dehalococcoidales bacterium]
MIARRHSKQIHIGSVAIGGDAPISVQSMTCTDTRDARATIDQIRELEEAGCELVRVAVPDMEAARALPDIKKGIHIPLIADIHFDYRLALAAIEAGVDALRLNPGNIRDPEKTKAVVKAAKKRSIPIRIGVNAGSLPQQESKADACDAPSVESVASRMVELALAQVRLLESLDFDLIKLSLKAFDVPTTIEAYRQIAQAVPYPLHLGITEAGTPWAGSIRSAVGIGALLLTGIGDTLRVSLTGDPVEEVRVGFEILKALGLRQRGPVMISCPTCGRTEIELVKIAQEVEQKLEGIKAPIKVAVMGCVVNGPGEARDADVGIAGGGGRGVVFRYGRVVRTVDEKDLLPALLHEIDIVASDWAGSRRRDQFKDD